VQNYLQAAKYAEETPGRHSKEARPDRDEKTIFVAVFQKNV
jgi:hypothetical protein